MGLLQQLDSQYQRQGYRTYSKHVPALKNAPERWLGPLPDLIAEKEGETTVAVFFETTHSLRDPLSPGRWLKAKENRGADLKLFVHKQEELDLLRTILDRERIKADIALVERKFYRIRASRFDRARVIRLAVALVLVAAACYLILLIASYFYGYSLEYYEPRDFERESVTG